MNAFFCPLNGGFYFAKIRGFKVTDYTREQNAPSRSRDNLGAVVRYRNSTGTLQELYGDSTGTLRALLDAAEVRPEPVRLIERLGAFRDGDLDG